MAKVISINEAAEMVKDGMTVMVAGFWGIGAPEKVIDAVIEKGTTDLTGISISTSVIEKGFGKFFEDKRIKKAIVSFNGRNTHAQEQYKSGELEIEFSPQGTLVERIRAGGFGIGGFLTPTGVGTEVQEGKQLINLDGKDYLLEKGLKAEVALLKCAKADKAGNLVYRKTARNSNPLMAAAADVVIVQADEIVEIGDIDPDDVMTPGILVDYIVQG